MKGILARVLLDKDEKTKGDEVPIQCFKEPLADAKLMHKKIDVISHHLGILFLQRDPGTRSHARFREKAVRTTPTNVEMHQRGHHVL